MFDKYIMNYTLHYEKLITRAENRQLDCYTETHHIIPRCLGGTDNPNNLVELTPEEHLVSHLLLMKIHDHKSLVYAAIRMHNRVKNNKEYGYLKRKFAAIMKDKMSGEGNVMYGKKHNEHTLQKMRDIKIGKKDSDDTKLRKRNAGLNRTDIRGGWSHSPEAIEKIRLSSTGENNGMFGRKHSNNTKSKIGAKSVGRKPRLGVKLSDETKEKCRIAALNRTPKECEYCQKIISSSNYSRWHGKNCKLKDIDGQ